MQTSALPVLAPMLLTGSVLRHEALDLGLSAAEIQDLVRSGSWVRIRRGAYADASDFGALRPEQQHLVRARAVVRGLGQPAVLGHLSAVIAHGLPVWGADLDEVHVIRPGRTHASRREAGVAHHSATLPDDHVTEVEGLLVTSVARSVVDHARTSGYESGVCSADAALHRDLVGKQELLAMLEWQQDWPKSRSAGRAVAFSDGRAESVGESRGRVRIDQAGLPTPQPQAIICDPSGVLVARVDFLMPEQATIGEFDGRVKYRGDDDGDSAQDAVWQEKLREDRLRALGFQVVRFIWDDLERGPARLRRLFLPAFERARLSPPPRAIIL
jgi:hypothetical protein